MCKNARVKFIFGQIRDGLLTSLIFTTVCYTLDKTGITPFNKKEIVNYVGLFFIYGTISFLPLPSYLAITIPVSFIVHNIS